MAALTLQSIPVEDITARAERIRFGRFVLSLAGWAFYAVGYLTAVSFAVAWKSARWCAAAFMVGWESTHGPTTRQKLAAANETIRLQNIQLSRYSG